MGRAIVREPAAFLMDEPLSNLDAKLRTQTRLELVELWRRLETTFVYVTHDQVEAMTMATRIAVLEGGRLQQVGAPQAVYEHPANLFVATFIGSPPMNVLAGTVSGSHVETAAGTIPVADVGTAAGAVVAGVRPESVRVAGSDVPGDVRATVLNVELLGHERHIVCQVGDGRWTVRQTSTDGAIAVGDQVGLAVDPAAVHLFDPATTARVN
jgi:ABC-type sugar transport system ATPase subunit